MSDTAAISRSCFGCLATVPCPSLVAWIGAVMSVVAWCGSVMAASRIAAATLSRQNYIPVHESDVVAVSVVCAVVLLVSLFLILASLSSLSPRSISILNTSVKVTCARVLSIIAVVMSFVMCVVGMVTLVTLAVPLIFLLLITYLITVLHFDSINLKNYGLFTTDYVIQGLELDEFYSKSQELLICISIASIAVVGFCISLILFMLFATTNAVHLQHVSTSLTAATATPGTDGDGLDNHLSDSANSVIDTKM